MSLTKYLNPFNYIRYNEKRKLLKRFKKIGNNFIFHMNSSFLTPEYIEIGNDVFIGEMAHISAEVSIGDGVMFGPRPVIIGGDHYFGVKGRSNRFLHPKDRETYEKVTLEDEVWCGANVLILGGVTIGMGAIIGAGSVVTKSIPPYTVAVGNPCRPLKKIFSDEVLLEHLLLLKKTEPFAREIIDRRNSMLIALKSVNLPVIDKTLDYWEFKPQNA